MRRLLGRVIPLAVLGVGAFAFPAAAGHNADQHSANMREVAASPRSSPATQSDLAFKGKLAFAGNYNGLRIFDISDPDNPALVKDVWCPGPQNDVSVWGDAVVLSVDSVMTGPECGSVPAAPVTLETGWEGLRVFSLKEIMSTPADPDGFTRVQPAADVYTKCGSHTHTGIPHKGHVDIYVSSYPLRSGPDCGPHDDASDTHNPLHELISIAQIDPQHPANSSFLKEVPIDVPTFNEDPQFLPPPAFNAMRGCHDIQVHLKLHQAAAACSSVGQVWDISDPHNPGTLDPLWEVDEPEVHFYHSALFSNDTDTVIFGDEIIAGHCFDGTGSGQLWFYDSVSGALQSSYNIPRNQGGAYCSAHMFNNVPGTKQDVLVSSWYAGGITVVDFTDRSNPTEIAYYDPAGGSVWSAYWYNDYIYASDIPFGTRFVQFTDPSPGRERHQPFLDMNPQTQK